MESWQELVQKRLKKKNAILFQPADSLFSELNLLLDSTNSKAIICWALELCKEANKRILEINPKENRGTIAIEQSTLWANKVIKMPIAKKAILDCHRIAKETDNKELIALAHAIGQGCSCVHTPKHAMGYPIYDLTTLVLKEGFKEEEIERKLNFYIEKLKKAIGEETSK